MESLSSGGLMGSSMWPRLEPRLACRGQQRQVRRELAVPARAPALLPNTAKQIVPLLGTQASLGLPSFQLASVEVAGPHRGAGGDSDEGLGAREGGAGAGNASEQEAWSPVSGALSQRDIGVHLIHIKPRIVPGAVGTVVTFGIWLTERWGPGGGQGQWERKPQHLRLAVHARDGATGHVSLCPM